MLAPSHIPIARASGAAAVTVQSMERYNCPTLRTAPWKTPMVLAFTTAAPDHDDGQQVRNKSEEQEQKPTWSSGKKKVQTLSNHGPRP